MAAAINGTALGGGFELTLACHHRVASGYTIHQTGVARGQGRPVAGAGGTQRLPRLLGASEALQLMLLARAIWIRSAPCNSAPSMRFVEASDLVAAAKRWVLEDRRLGTAPGTSRGYRIPRCANFTPKGMMTWAAANAIYRRETYDNYPAQRAIMSCVYEGLMVPIDVGLRIEARYFTSVTRTPEAGNMIRSLFLSQTGTRQAGPPPGRPGSVRGHKTRHSGRRSDGLRDRLCLGPGRHAGDAVRHRPACSRCRQGAHGGIARRGCTKKAVSSPRRRRLRLTGSRRPVDYDALVDCDLVIEAVFENRDIKDKVTRAAEPKIGDGAVFASNTSSLPISSLSTSSSAARELHRHPLLLTGRKDAAGRNHHRRGDL